MDAIKSKMKKLSGETADATDKANKFDAEGNEARLEAEKIESGLATLQKKYQTQGSRVLQFAINVKNRYCYKWVFKCGLHLTLHWDACR